MCKYSSKKLENPPHLNFEVPFSLIMVSFRPCVGICGSLAPSPWVFFFIWLINNFYRLKGFFGKDWAVYWWDLNTYSHTYLLSWFSSTHFTTVVKNKCLIKYYEHCEMQILKSWILKFQLYHHRNRLQFIISNFWLVVSIHIFFIILLAQLYFGMLHIWTTVVDQIS